MLSSASTAITLPYRRESGTAVEITGLRKQFGDEMVVNVDRLRARSGDVVGVVGRGKTTVLAMLAGVLPPDEGAIRVFGLDVWQDWSRATAPMASTPLDGARPCERATLRTMATGTGLLRGMSATEVARATRESLKRVGLAGAADEMIGVCSPGTRSRLFLACALLTRPRLLVLDEPFRGADAGSTRILQVVLTEFAAAGGTVVLSGECPRGLCDEVWALDAY